MTDFSILLQNPELAKNVRFEITGLDLLRLASALAEKVRLETMEGNRTKEAFLTLEEVATLTRRNRSTLHKWNAKGILQANQLGLYKQSDVLRLLETK